MAVYAKVPEGLCTEYADYLSPGGEYLVKAEDGQLFYVDDDAGEPLICRWDRCLHLDEVSRLAGWQRIEREDEA